MTTHPVIRLKKRIARAAGGERRVRRPRRDGYAHGSDAVGGDVRPSRAAQTLHLDSWWVSSGFGIRNVARRSGNDQPVRRAPLTSTMKRSGFARLLCSIVEWSGSVGAGPVR